MSVASCTTASSSSGPSVIVRAPSCFSCSSANTSGVASRGGRRAITQAIGNPISRIGSERSPRPQRAVGSCPCRRRHRRRPPIRSHRRGVRVRFESARVPRRVPGTPGRGLSASAPPSEHTPGLSSSFQIAGSCDAPRRRFDDTRRSTTRKKGVGAMNGRPNIVLVHGAWADGSCWSGVIERLQADGFQVRAPQFPLTSLADDVARLRQVLEFQDGPTIVVGHSYGGQTITPLVENALHVVGILYIAAFGLDEGETLGTLLSQGPVTPALAHLF